MCRVTAGEYISVSSQKDAEEADIEKERQEQLKGPEARRRELEELTGIYVAVSSSSSSMPGVCLLCGSQGAAQAYASSGVCVVLVLAWGCIGTVQMVAALSYCCGAATCGSMTTCEER
jgi:hypothetical protein